MENKKGGELIGRRPEAIIEARFKLTKKQNDIVDMVLASIEDDGKLEYQIDVAKYGKLYNIKDRSNIYRDLKKAVSTFEGKGFSLSTKDKDNKEHRIYFSWFSSIDYIDGESKIILELGQKLKTLMLSAKKACFYQLKYTLNFNNIYSKRLYYYLKSYENSRKVTNLKFYINTNKSNIKAIDEICATTESKSTDEEEKCSTELISEVKAIFKEDITGLEAKTLLDTANGDINIIKEKYEIAKVTHQA